MMQKFDYFKKLDQVDRKKHPIKTRSFKLRLDKNERISQFSHKFFNSFKRKLNSEDITKYPELNKSYELLAKKLKISKDCILLTSGSDIAIRTCFETYANSSSEVVTISPTYGMVDVYASIYLTKQKKVFFDNNLNLNVNKIIQCINKNTSLVIIANPNSPTGTLINKVDMLKILKKTKKFKAYILIDECYFDYSKKSFIKELKNFSNLIICRSFSKSGLAGERVGYLVSNKKNIFRMSKFRPMYEISSLSAKFLEHSLLNYWETKNYLKEVLVSKKNFEKQLKEMGLKVFNSSTNFILVDFLKKEKKNKVLKTLIKNDILVTEERAIPGDHQIIRFSIGPKKYMSTVVNIIKKIVV